MVEFWIWDEKKELKNHLFFILYAFHAQVQRFRILSLLQIDLVINGHHAEGDHNQRQYKLNKDLNAQTILEELSVGQIASRVLHAHIRPWFVWRPSFLIAEQIEARYRNRHNPDAAHDVDKVFEAKLGLQRVEDDIEAVETDRGQC